MKVECLVCGRREYTRPATAIPPLFLVCSDCAGTIKSLFAAVLILGVALAVVLSL